jgi:hypothetical protein
MKRAIAVVICAAMIVVLLPVSTAPVGAVWKEGSFSIIGARVDYQASASYTWQGKYMGYVSAELNASWYSCPSLVMAAGVRYLGFTWPAYNTVSSLETCGLVQPSVWGNALYSLETPIQSGWDVSLRIVVRSGWGAFNFWAGARCWTWEPYDADLTRDYAKEDDLVAIALVFSLAELGSLLMGPYF